MDSRKSLLKTDTQSVGFGGDECARFRDSADLRPNVPELFVTPKVDLTQCEPIFQASALAPAGFPHDSCIEWPDRKLSEEARAKFCGMLIEAQEKERASIARELHDDIAQRIALLAVHLGQWDQDVLPSTPDVHNHIREVSRGLSDILQGIRALSHHLHSSSLDYIGLAAAASSFCHELSEKRNVTIDFSQTGIPRDVPKEVSLCLFRVLQEALQNAVKHSAVKHFRVELTGTSQEIHLSVSDSGVGFNRAEDAPREGLGMISMQERMHLIGGELMVHSEPNRGTTICACAPLNRNSIESRPLGTMKS